MSPTTSNPLLLPVFLIISTVAVSKISSDLIDSEEYSPPVEVFINEIVNVIKEVKIMKESAAYESQFEQAVYYKQATWIKGVKTLDKYPIWNRWIRNLWNIIWYDSKNWQNRKLIHTTDGQLRYKWSVNFTDFHDDITPHSGGRIRLVDGDVYIAAAEEADSGIYTCWEISERGIYIHHTKLIVRRFNLGILNFTNPIVLFKWALLLVLHIFVLIAAYEFTQFDTNKAVGYAELMKSTLDSAAKDDMLQGARQRAIEFELYGHAKLKNLKKQSTPPRRGRGRKNRSRWSRWSRLG